jgi:hypothetical protein
MKIWRNQKGVIESRKSKKDSQCNDHKKINYKRTNNDLQKITQKTIDWATATPQKPKDELRCSGRVNSSCSTSGIRCATLVKQSSSMSWIEKGWYCDYQTGTYVNIFPDISISTVFASHDHPVLLECSSYCSIINFLYNASHCFFSFVLFHFDDCMVCPYSICGFWYLFGMFSFVLCFSKLFQLPGMSRLPNTLIKVIMQSIYSVHLELMIILVNTIRALILLIWFELHTDFLNEGFTTGSMDGATVFKTLWILSQFVDGVRAISYMLKCISMYCVVQTPGATKLKYSENKLFYSVENKSSFLRHKTFFSNLRTFSVE